MKKCVSKLAHLTHWDRLIKKYFSGCNVINKFSIAFLLYAEIVLSDLLKEAK